MRWPVRDLNGPAYPLDEDIWWCVNQLGNAIPEGLEIIHTVYVSVNRMLWAQVRVGVLQGFVAAAVRGHAGRAMGCCGRGGEDQRRQPRHHVQKQGK